jgi:HSP20 family molecular chaperone IbpA
MGTVGTKELTFTYYNDEWPLLADIEAQPAQTQAPVVPPIDVFQEGDAVVVRAALPGMEEDEIDVEVAAGFITISGVHAHEREKDAVDHERLVPEFSRSIALPADVDVTDVTARLNEGVLEVRAHAKPRPHRVHLGVRAANL